MDFDDPNLTELSNENEHEPAPKHHLPTTTYYVVEYPGRVKPTSVPDVVKNLGGMAVLESAFRRGASKQETLVELHLRPDNPFSHPVPANIVNSTTMMMKVVKRKRKNANPEDPVQGEYTAQMVGVVPKTVRFRHMADFQFQPEADDSMTKLRMALEHMDVESICKYTIPPEKYDFTIPVEPQQQSRMDIDIDPALLPEAPTSQTTSEQPTVKSNLRLFPPPIFSRQHIPQHYNFKANSASIVSSVVDEETGEEKTRLINRMRWKGYGPATISFADSTLPSKPPPNVEAARSQVDATLLKKLGEHFKQRPVWTRTSLFNQFPPQEAREIHNSKLILPLVCYVFQDGPWRDTLVRFNYDPRSEPEARLYQRLYFRNANHPISRPSVTTRRQDRTAYNVLLDPSNERRMSHVFDGQTLSKETAAFQLVDIHDPMLKTMIEDPAALRETCDERDGWYTTYSYERIKAVLRHKFFSLLQGHIAPNEECERLLDTSESATQKLSKNMAHRPRPGKHNMAKGALPPADAAAIRLKGILDRNAKSVQIPGRASSSTS
ncbi:hypothetical protein CYLTODRAFT_366742 [Cylindrobasidium torrendii FP15055 ss-10]|uniref:RNA polymerase III transcription factor IIIC subunit n=1 Tax=Cylindrobasidium torrendii FP15055 ss-10 TaxID=1314674 RepID=A0A0D7BTL8_9AGAR|nr:hypothetical protein CYLTODRAFT_366742 [Cylindrobasidium torrendii FP15055 ss-10]